MIEETVAIFNGVKRTLGIRRLLESMIEGSNNPKPVMEDNQITITQIKKDPLNPRIKPLDIVLS